MSLIFGIPLASWLEKLWIVNLDSTIHHIQWISIRETNNLHYSVESDLSGGKSYPHFERMNTGVLYDSTVCLVHVFQRRKNHVRGFINLVK